MKLAVVFTLGFMVIVGIWISISPDIIGKVFGRFVNRRIDSNELVKILQTTPIKYASTEHSQNFLIETRWGFYYSGIWNPNQVSADYGIHISNENKNDVLNLISAYSKEYGYDTLICCE